MQSSFDGSAACERAIKNLLSKKFEPPETYNEIATTALASIGFHHVSQIRKMGGHSVLLETHTFHLPVGKVTVTLEAVTHILDLPINGEPMTDRTDSSHEYLVENCLAVFSRPLGPNDHILGKVNLARAIKNLLTKKFDLQKTYNEIATAALASSRFHHVSQISEMGGTLYC
ncbi:hypothetical protein Ahy_B09g098779 [Arachis hypogaea]|uniref:Aminotransferase-like plant mobile domain-containing protein n=1 Tax=Arachis hypogaea TaxID=3818 RepID=A0A444XS12_ARAHY|nr:hypothetical protein Ahy_B09g098779 [Arachis hypogaea]